MRLNSPFQCSPRAVCHLSRPLIVGTGVWSPYLRHISRLLALVSSFHIGLKDILKEKPCLFAICLFDLGLRHIGRLAYLQAETLEETIESGPLCITDLRLAYKKRLKNKNKIFPKNKIFFFLPFFYATFQCGRYNVFNFFFFFLPTKS